MAADSESLILSISADVRQVKRALDRLVVDSAVAAKGIERAFVGTGAAANSAVTQINKVDAAMSRSAKTMQGFSASFKSGLGGLGIGIGVGFAVQQTQQIIDASTKIANSLKVAGLEGAEFDKVFNKLGATAIKYGSSFESLASVFSRVAIVQNELGVSTEQLTAFTENVSAALKIQGTSAQDAQGPLLQLSQLLSTGTVRAEEFNSVNEGLPIVLKTVAQGLYGAGAGIQDLRKQMLAQNLTSKDFFEGFMKGSANLQDQAGKAGATFAQSFEKVRTALIIAAREFENSTGAVAGLADAISTLVEGTVALLRVYKAISESSFGDAAKQIVKPLLNPLGTLKDASEAAKILANDFVGDQAKMSKALDDTATEVIKLSGTLDGVGQGADLGQFEKQWADIVEAFKNGELTINQVVDAQIELNRAMKEADTGDDTFAPAIKALQTLRDSMEQLGDGIKEVDRSLKEGAVGFADYASVAIKMIESIAASAAKNVNTLTSAVKQAISEAMNDLERMNREISKGAPLGQIPPVYSGGGQFLDEQGVQDWRGQQAGLAGYNKEMERSIDLIKEREGFIGTAKWDVNHFRVGFGSDTITDEMGRVTKVVKGTTVTVEAANRDLYRRVGEFQQGIQRSIGAETWKSLTENQQAALTSITYNYGELPQRIVKAINDGGGPGAVAEAINALGADNEGINKERRAQEAELYGGAAFKAPSTREPKKTPAEVFTKDTEETQRRIDALQAEYDAINKTNPIIKDYGYNVAYAAEQQRLLGEAQKAGVEITPELQAQINGLADGYARASANVEELKTTQADAAQAAADFGSMAKDFLSGFISDLRSGKSATEALGNALGRLADRLLDMALDSLFSAKGPLGNLFGSLLGGGVAPGLEEGGIVGDPNLPHYPVNPRDFKHAKSYARGGMPGKPPGSIPVFAHPGEVILPKGMVGNPTGNTAVGNKTNISNQLGPVTIDMAGSGVVAAGNQQAKQFGENVRAIIAQEMVRESRPGGLLRPGGAMR